MNRAQRRASLRGARARPVGYGVTVEALDRHDWNTSEERAALREEPCGGGCYVMLAMTTPVNARDFDAGVVVVWFVSIEHRPSEVMPAIMLAIAQVMDEKHGDHWAPTGDSLLANGVPEWQVDPDEPPITRAEGLARLAGAAVT